MNTKHTYSQEYENINVDYKRGKEKYNVWEGSPYWNNYLDLSQFPDVIIHLMLLEVTKATQLLVQRWMSAVLKSKQFNLNIKSIFAPIMSMGIGGV